MNFVLSKNDYIRIHITPTLTYLRSSLQTSLQNQTKQEGNEKVTSLSSGVKVSLMNNKFKKFNKLESLKKKREKKIPNITKKKMKMIGIYS